jgi:RNA polymerase sigma factor (sigma-70 family)
MHNSPSNRKSLAPVLRPEQVLERYYPQLCEWATILLRGDRTKSEDIVHDFYLYVALTKPDLSRVENLDNYLFQSLRHMYLSTVSRASREATQAVSISDYDSIRVALWIQPHHDTLQHQNELRRICNYAVWRKPQLRGASYFVLKFFHGYRIQEIAEIACVSITAVERRLSEARAEVREYLTEPSKQPALRPMPPAPEQGWGPVSSQTLLRELRSSILNSRTGDCLSQAELERHSSSLNRKPVSTSALSHVVSCEACLARIDGIFRRPTLKDREPLDGIDGFDGDGSGRKNDPPLASGHRALLRKVEKHREDVYDHRPRTISIAVDGRIIASHEIQPQRNVLSVTADRVEKSTFVEVLSEQGLRLAMLWFDELPPHGAHEQRQHINLSDDRWIGLTLTIDGRGLTAEAVYFTPLATPINALALSEDDGPLAPILLEMEPGPSQEAQGERSLGGASVSPRQTDRKQNFGALWTRLWSWLNAYMPAMNPLLASALALGVASVLCFFAWMHRTPSMTATTLLQRAERWDAGSSPVGESRVIYQKVRIETPRKTMERSIYRDSAGRRRPKQQPLSPDEEQIRDRLVRAGINWNQPLSAATYESWRERQPVAKDVVTSGEGGLLTLTTTAPSDPQIKQETFTVRENDFHPVSRTVELRDAGTIEIAEVNYSVLPWSAVNPDIFEPLAPISEVNGSHLHASLLPHLPHAVTPGEMDLAELSARLVLNRLGFDANSRIEISRGTDGVNVQGIVDTETQKNQLQAQLRLVPHVLPSILTVQEMTNNPTPNSEITSIQQSSDGAEVPSSLERYFAERGLDHQGLSSTSQEFVEGSFAVKRETRQVVTLLQRFSSDRALPSEARSALEELLVQHKTALLTALGREERALMDVQLIQSSSHAAVSNGNLPESLRKDADENFALCIELTSDSQSASRSAQVIAPQLSASIAELRAAALQISATALPLSPSPGNAGLASKND